MAQMQIPAWDIFFKYFFSTEEANDLFLLLLRCFKRKMGTSAVLPPFLGVSPHMYDKR